MKEFHNLYHLSEQFAYIGVAIWQILYLNGEINEKERANEKILFIAYSRFIVSGKFTVRRNLNWYFYDYAYGYKTEYFSRLLHTTGSQER